MARPYLSREAKIVLKDYAHDVDAEISMDMFKTLESKGLVYLKANLGVELTEKGKQYARSLGWVGS